MMLLKEMYMMNWLKKVKKMYMMIQLKKLTTTQKL